MLIAPLALSWAAFAAVLPASDWTGVYANVRRVDLLPDAERPTRIAIHGAFALADPKDRRKYLEPAWGVLTYRLAGDEKDEERLTEWKDLARVAGSEEFLGFGMRGTELGEVRDGVAAEPPVYPIGWGLQRTRNASYEPLRALARIPEPRAPRAGADHVGTSVTLRVGRVRDAVEGLRYRFRIEGPEGHTEIGPPLSSSEEGAAWTPDMRLREGCSYTWFAWIELPSGARGPEARATFRVVAR